MAHPNYLLGQLQELGEVDPLVNAVLRIMRGYASGEAIALEVIRVLVAVRAARTEEEAVRTLAEWPAGFVKGQPMLCIGFLNCQDYTQACADSQICRYYDGGRCIRAIRPRRKDVAGGEG